MIVAAAIALAAAKPVDKLSACAMRFSHELAFKEPTETAAIVAETALQLCYEQNLEAQNAFREEQRRADPAVTADDLVARWEGCRSTLRTALIEAVAACRRPGEQCPPTP